MMLKKILIGFAAILVLGALALAFVLVPAHRQIRDIERELPTKDDLAALAQTPDGPAKIAYINTASQEAGERSVGHSTFLVEWADGKILLIDLGMDAPTAVEFGELFETIAGADPAVSHGTLPEFLGDELSRVKGVGFTHLHVDHVQGIQPVCAAHAGPITVLQTADQSAKHNLHTADQSAMLDNSDCIRRSVLSADGRISDQFPGIGIYPLGGHTPGSTMFAVPVDGKLWLLTGDISNVHADMIENRDKGFVYSYLMVPEHVDRLAILRMWLTDLDSDPNMTAIVSHDIKAIAASGMDAWQKSAMPE